MRFPSWLSLPPKLPGLFLVATLVPVAALVWLGWHLLEQDRALENQRILERLEVGTDLIAAAIDRRIAEMQDRLSTPATALLSADLPADALTVRLGAHSLDAYPPGRLLFSPQVTPVPQAPVTSNFNQPLDVELHLPTQIALNFIVLPNIFA